jgi:hypothetical protein
MTTILNPILSLARTLATETEKKKTKQNNKQNTCVSVGVPPISGKSKEDVNAERKRANRLEQTNTNRAGSSSHKAQNGPQSQEAQAALDHKRDLKKIKNKMQRLRKQQVIIDLLVADLSQQEQALRIRPPSVVADSVQLKPDVVDPPQPVNGSDVIDTCEDSESLVDIDESSGVNAEEAPAQYTYRWERLYTRSPPAPKEREMNDFVIPTVIAAYDPSFTRALFVFIPYLAIRCAICYYYRATKNKFDPKTLVADPQNLRPHKNTVVDYSVVGDQMALVGFTSYSEVKICVEVYNHFLSGKTGTKFSDRTYQNLWTEAFHTFSRPPVGVTPIDKSIIEDTAYVFGQYLHSMHLRSKYHFPSSLDQSVPDFKHANWWNQA